MNEWTRTTRDGCEVWTHTDGQRTVAASVFGVMAILGARVGRYVKGERKLLELLAYAGDEETESVLIRAWAYHVRAVIERDADMLAADGQEVSHAR